MGDGGLTPTPSPRLATALNMFLSTSPRASWLAVSAACVLVFVFGLLAWHSPPRIQFPSPKTDM